MLDIFQLATSFQKLRRLRIDRGFGWAVDEADDFDEITVILPYMTVLELRQCMFRVDLSDLCILLYKVGPLETLIIEFDTLCEYGSDGRLEVSMDIDCQDFFHAIAIHRTSLRNLHLGGLPFLIPQESAQLFCLDTLSSYPQLKNLTVEDGMIWTWTGRWADYDIHGFIENLPDSLEVLRLLNAPVVSDTPDTLQAMEDFLKTCKPALPSLRLLVLEERTQHRADGLPSLEQVMRAGSNNGVEVLVLKSSGGKGEYSLVDATTDELRRDWRELEILNL